MKESAFISIGNLEPTVIESATYLEVETIKNKEINKGLRPVIYATKLETEKANKGWFHKWVTYADTDGVEEFALVETESGEMLETYTHKIKFTDRCVK